jgi:hypothetical protein
MTEQSESEDFRVFEELNVLSKGPGVWSLNICHGGLRKISIGRKVRKQFFRRKL